jgi:Golgi nucleoside diphosphatase
VDAKYRDYGFGQKMLEKVENIATYELSPKMDRALFGQKVLKIHNKSIPGATWKSPFLLLTIESACRVVGSFLSRHASLVTAL